MGITIIGDIEPEEQIQPKRYYRKDCVVEYKEPKQPQKKIQGWKHVGYDRSGQLCIWDE